MLKKIFITVALVVLVLIIGGVYVINQKILTDVENPSIEVIEVVKNIVPPYSNFSVRMPLPPQTTIVKNLTIPWDIVFLPLGDLLVSERAGTITRLNVESGTTTEVAIIGVSSKGEGGLLGMVSHPNFSENNFIYTYLTSTLEDGTNASVNRVLRYEFFENQFINETVIIDSIPGSLFHNGGRIAFGPDGYLYVTTGDARDPASAQDLDSLAGKILRSTDTGEIPTDNPFGTLVYSYGHRNPQGLTWDDDGRLWSTEHGRTTATQTGMDELNLIIPGGNYGWPESEGDVVLSETIAPAIHSGATTTWAPGGAVYANDSVFFGGLRGETLYQAVIVDDEVSELREYFVGDFGRIRTTLVGPDKGLYIMTSNQDGRGNVKEGDDQIVRFNLNQFIE